MDKPNIKLELLNIVKEWALWKWCEADGKYQGKFYRKLVNICWRIS